MTTPNYYSDKIKAIKSKLQKEVQEKEDTRNLIDSVWSSIPYQELELLSFLTSNLK